MHDTWHADNLRQIRNGLAGFRNFRRSSTRERAYLGTLITNRAMRQWSYELKAAFLLIGFTLLAFSAILLSGPGFCSRWSEVRDGMTQAEVRQLLGTPSWIGNGYCQGVGGKPVTRWEYKINLPGRCVCYYVDFDYIGPGGSPAVFRTERFCREWLWLWQATVYA